MSIVDKAIAAVTPPESEEKRAKARQEARAAAQPGDWLSTALDHHLQIEQAVAAIKACTDAASRKAAQKELAVVLTGHATAEETVLYPALAQVGEKGHANMGYTEQVAVKMQMAELDNIDPMSEAYLDKLGHIQGALQHHMYEEEGSWFQELKSKAPTEVQQKLNQRFAEEFDRYVGGGSGPGQSAMPETRSWEARPDL